MAVVSSGSFTGPGTAQHVETSIRPDLLPRRGLQNGCGPADRDRDGVA